MNARQRREEVSFYSFGILGFRTDALPLRVCIIIIDVNLMWKYEWLAGRTPLIVVTFRWTLEILPKINK